MLGQPVARCLADRGHRVRVLVRSAEKARRMYGDTVEVVEGSALDRDHIQAAMAGCDAVHINLTQESELTATQHVVDLAQGVGLEGRGAGRPHRGQCAAWRAVDHAGRVVQDAEAGPPGVAALSSTTAPSWRHSQSLMSSRSTSWRNRLARSRRCSIGMTSAW